MKTTGGSTHFDGFILNTNYSSADNSINDFFTTLDKGIPWGSKGLPPSAASLPFVDPTLNNNSNVNFWQRSDSGRPAPGAGRVGAARGSRPTRTSGGHAVGVGEQEALPGVQAK